jgi:hypothetical protein
VRVEAARIDSSAAAARPGVAGPLVEVAADLELDAAEVQHGRPGLLTLSSAAGTRSKASRQQRGPNAAAVPSAVERAPRLLEAQTVRFKTAIG